MYSQRHAGVTARIPNDEQIELGGLRFDIVIDLSRGYSDQGVREVEVRMPCSLCLPYGVQAVATDAAGQVGMELSRVISQQRTEV